MVESALIPAVLEKNLKKYGVKEYPPAITLDDVPNTIPYKVGSMLPKNGVHIGQRKLGLSEIQFLTEHPCDYIVYAGSSPSNKIYMISQLFPKTRFVLIDPRPANIFVDEKRTVYNASDESIPEKIRNQFASLDRDMSGEDLQDVITDSESPVRIFMIKGYFDDKLARKLAPIGANFISDIRSITERADIAPQDIDILWNLSQQYNWMRIMKPPVSCVKFRNIFYGSSSSSADYFLEHYEEEFYQRTFRTSAEYGIDFVQGYKDKIMQYPRGVVHLQAWAGPSSTETRLYIKASDLESVHDYDLYDYEDRLNFYNAFYRRYVNHKNAYADRDTCFRSCNDCAIEASI
jgi:hypothetical protein